MRLGWRGSCEKRWMFKDLSSGWLIDLIVLHMIHMVSMYYVGISHSNSHSCFLFYGVFMLGCLWSVKEYNRNENEWAYCFNENKITDSWFSDFTGKRELELCTSAKIC